MSTEPSAEGRRALVVVSLWLLALSCADSGELRIGKLPNREFPVAFVAKLSDSGVGQILGPFGIEAGQVTFAEGSLELSAVEGDRFVMLGMTPEAHETWRFDPRSARMRLEPESCLGGRLSALQGQDRVRLPINEPSWVALVASPEAPEFLETALAQIDDFPPVAMEADYDAEPCQPDESVQLQPWGRNVALLPTLVGIFGDDPTGFDDRTLRQFNAAIPIGHDHLVAQSFGGIYWFDRRAEFTDQAHERVGIHQVLRLVSRQIDPDHLWRFSGMAAQVLGNGRGRLFVTATVNRLDPESFVVELSFDLDGLTLVGTSSIVRLSLRDVVVGTDGAIAAIDDDGVILSGPSLDSLAPTLDLQGDALRAMASGLSEPAHLVGGSSGFIAAGDLFGPRSGFAVDHVWSNQTVTSVAGLPGVEADELWIGSESAELAFRPVDETLWTKMSVFLPPRLAMCGQSLETDCGRLPLASASSGIELGVVGGELYQLLAFEDCPELILRDPARNCITSVGSKAQTPGHMKTLVREDDEVWIAGAQSEVWALTAPRP